MNDKRKVLSGLNMFKNLFKKNIEPMENVKEVIVPCTCEKDNENCDLVLKLREFQKLKKLIENEIEVFNKYDNDELLIYTINFLKNLEANGMCMDKYYGKMNSKVNSLYALRRTIGEYSSVDIFRVAEELKTYKNKADIVYEKQKALKAVEDDISNIKSKLGIE